MEIQTCPKRFKTPERSKREHSETDHATCLSHNKRGSTPRRLNVMNSKWSGEACTAWPLWAVDESQIFVSTHWLPPQAHIEQASFVYKSGLFGLNMMQSE